MSSDPASFGAHGTEGLSSFASQLHLFSRHGQLPNRSFPKSFLVYTSRHG